MNLKEANKLADQINDMMDGIPLEDKREIFTKAYKLRKLGARAVYDKAESLVNSYREEQRQTNIADKRSSQKYNF